MTNVLIVEAYEKAFTNFRERFLDSLVQNGFAVTAAAPEISSSMRANLVRRGIAPAEYTMIRASTNPVRELRTIYSLAALIGRIRPSLIVAFGPKTVIYSGLAARIAGSSLAMGVVTGLGHGFSGRGFRGRLILEIQKLLYRASLRQHDAIYFQNHDDRRLFERLSITKNVPKVGVVGGSGVDMEKFSPVPVPVDGAAFLFVGRLVASKGIEEFMRAAIVIAEKYPDSKFRVAGWFDAGRSDAFTEKRFQELKHMGRVEYLGRLDDIRPAIEDSNVLVLPSHHGEGTPRSVLEGLAMKRAIITTQSPGCRETVIDGTTGYLVPVRNSEALIAAMEHYAKDPRLAERHGQAGHQLARQRYAVDIVNATLMEDVKNLTMKAAQRA